MVQLVTLQQVLRQRGQSSLQMASRETLQRWPAVSQTGPHQPGTDAETETQAQEIEIKNRKKLISAHK